MSGAENERSRVAVLGLLQLTFFFQCVRQIAKGVGEVRLKLNRFSAKKKIYDEENEHRPMHSGSILYEIDAFVSRI